MSSHLYTRPVGAGGKKVGIRDVDSSGDSLRTVIATELPGKDFDFKFDGDDVTVMFQATLDGAEETLLSDAVSGYTSIDIGEVKDWTVKVTQDDGDVYMYAVDNGDGTYSELVESVVLEKAQGQLISRTHTWYSTTGIIQKQLVNTFFQNGTDKIMKRD